MRFHVRAAALAAMPLYLGCGIVENVLFACPSESREVTATGTANGDAVEVAVHVGASRGADNWRYIAWSTIAPSLAGHIVSVALARSTDPTEILVRLPVSAAATGSTAGGSLTQDIRDQHPPLGGIFEIVADNRARLEITTDLPGQSIIRVPLTATETRDWTRGQCA
jgi:hypothetical protein